ncbi:39S ribosomal protein L18, mitochondrial isoform X1 [Cricetulus griseus]|uniref:Large ribosomal subunit protein uL18m n=1 Tax=Cricetulus griseus TaxID=10029 RepID=A0A9J7FCN5_CRIGR|nr:39S ribosomal protein L18, mitochondrial isoform X1 [Cricetulus griseus]
MALQPRVWKWLSVCGKLECGFAARSTSSSPAIQPEVETKENEAVAPVFTNRNPRNLELLGVARKERGWATVWPNREFWHRLQVIKTQHHIEALVEHQNGQVVVSASTREWAIKKHLYNTRNVVACESIGRVLAQRCLEAGINFMVYQPTPWEASSDSITQRKTNAAREVNKMKSIVSLSLGKQTFFQVF